jgi:hypothetical protein
MNKRTAFRCIGKSMPSFKQHSGCLANSFQALPGVVNWYTDDKTNWPKEQSHVKNTKKREEKSYKNSGV